jgi:excisionase family DNA binding protein
MTDLSFDMLPNAVSRLLNEVGDLKRLLLEKIIEQPKRGGEIFDVDEAAKFCRLSKPTIYALVSRLEIPHSKKGKRLYFSEDELKVWISEGRRKTQTELAADAKTYIAHKSKKRG